MDAQNFESHSHSQNSEFKNQRHESAVISHERRENMIAEAAYYMAVHRNFRNGDPIHDWLAAQKVIDSKIKGNNI